MAFVHTASGTGTDQELLDLARAQMAQILATGVAYTIDGRSLTRNDLPELRSTIEWLEARIDADAGSSAENLAQLKRT